MNAVLILVTLFAIALASRTVVKLSKQKQDLQHRMNEILQLEKITLRLFRYIEQPDYYDDQKEIAVNYDIEDHIDNYQNSQAVREFWDLNRLGFLPKDEVFSIFNENHRREAISLFKILYYAKDYETLYKTACWARVFMNGGLFVYSLSVALVHRMDTSMINLPPIYEIYPNYFYNMDVIRRGQEARQAHPEEVRGPFGNKQQPISPMSPMPPMQPIQPEPISTPPRQDRATTFNVPLTSSTEDRMYRGRAPPQLPYPLWNQMIPIKMRPMGVDPLLYGLDPMMEELRQRQLRQAQIMQKPIQPETLVKDGQGDDISMENRKMYPDVDNSIIIDANYSISLNDQDKELRLSYLMEDVGFNAFYYYYNIYYPFWLPKEMMYFRSDKRGEQFYYIMQQILARYYLERLSNGLGEISILDYSVPIRTGYYPSMVYPNGMMFPVRPNNVWVQMERSMDNTRFDNNYTNSYISVRDYDRRIRDAIDHGYVYSSDGKPIDLYDERGFEILGNMIEGNPETPNKRFYGGLQIFARLMLGNARPALVDREVVVVPSALEHFETSLRDPVFYRFYKRMLMHFQKYLSNVPPYSTKELLMPGVKIEDVQIVEPLMTYFEYDKIDISNAIYNKPVNTEHIPVYVRQMRLNSKPFRYVMNVNSDKAYNALVKVFLGPKYDETGRRLDITESRLNFVEIDKFMVDLAPGANRIQRSSMRNCYANDRTSYREMYRRVMMDLSQRNAMLEYEPRVPNWCLPRRLLLPKGNTKGQMYQMYFIITPSRPTSYQPSGMIESVMEWPMMLDGQSLGFPLDRPIDENYFYVPNSFFKDAVITHIGLQTDS
ncbi:hypothetical protein AMK59_6997 [Oryctes borbonicus]|uniref:Uncharacterized protein n=1 Tax=Oryctes borbonicus TaxID=1629725 RepID=A0A0T6AU86_9SCAR|nr:hypothetical protein AMK59_6997 [Oryctes borbonicus]